MSVYVCGERYSLCLRERYSMSVMTMSSGRDIVCACLRGKTQYVCLCLSAGRDIVCMSAGYVSTGRDIVCMSVCGE